TSCFALSSALAHFFLDCRARTDSRLGGTHRRGAEIAEMHAEKKPAQESSIGAADPTPISSGLSIPVIIGSFLTRVGGTHRTARPFSPKVTERLHTMTGWMRERLRCSADRAFENRLSFERRRLLGPLSL